MSTHSSLRRDDLERCPRTLLGRPSVFKPAVWRVETPEGPIVIKDARDRGFATRWIARLLLSRERKILGRLEGMDGVPQLLGAIDADAFALGFLPGSTLDKQLFVERPREILDRILYLTEDLHARGVFHLDLHNRKNLLVDDDGHLHLVDFGSAVAPGRLVRGLFGKLLANVDRQAGYKYLARFAPEALSEEEARAVVRHRTLRRLWPFTAHSRREMKAARARLRT